MTRPTLQVRTAREIRDEAVRIARIKLLKPKETDR